MPYAYSFENLPITRSRILDRPRNRCAAIACGALVISFVALSVDHYLLKHPVNAAFAVISILVVMIPAVMAVGFELAKVVMTIDETGFSYYADGKKHYYRWNEIETVHESYDSARGTRFKVLKIVRKGQTLKQVKENIRDVFDVDQKTLGRFLVSCASHFGTEQRPPDQPPGL